MKLLDKLKFADILALILVLGCLYLIASGRDGEVKTFLGVVIAYYFTRSIQVRRGSSDS